MKGNYPTHPLAEHYQLLEGEELELLAADIRANGLQHPVTLDPEGLVIDGRNRLAACDLAGVEPTFVTFDGDDVAGFIRSQNRARRHSSVGQLAMSEALILADLGKRKDGRWAYGAAVIENSENLRNWQKAMQQSGIVLDFRPDLAPDVRDGRLALDRAFREAETERDKQRQILAEEKRLKAEEADERAHLEANAPEYLAQVGDKFSSIHQAFAAWEDDHQREAAARRQAEREAEAKAKAEWESWRDQWQSIIKPIRPLAGVSEGNWELLEHFDTEMLTPNLRRDFTETNIEHAIDTLKHLIEWRNSWN